MRRDIFPVFTRPSVDGHSIRARAVGTAVPRRRSRVPRVSLLLRQRPPRVGRVVAENGRGRAGDEAKRGDAERGGFRRAVGRAHRGGAKETDVRVEE